MFCVVTGSPSSHRQESSNSAREALISVLDNTEYTPDNVTSPRHSDVTSQEQSDATSDRLFDDVFPMLPTSVSEPLLNMEIEPAKLKQRRTSKTADDTKRRSGSVSSQRTESKNAELLDKILNTDDANKDTFGGSAEDIPKETSKKFTKSHQRSRSDFVMKGTMVGSVASDRDESLSTSLPSAGRRLSLMEDGK